MKKKARIYAQSVRSVETVQIKKHYRTPKTFQAVRICKAIILLGAQVILLCWQANYQFKR